MAVLEGLYVDPRFRRAGAGRALVQAVAAWARERGLQELASDALLDNETGQRAYERLGCVEVERAVPPWPRMLGRGFWIPPVACPAEPVDAHSARCRPRRRDTRGTATSTSPTR